jgi:hypothetical protein
VTWLDERLAASGIRRTGAVEQPHLRPWATALRAPTDRGPVWLEAAGPETAFEVALYQLLERVAPERVLTPIATDPGRGWMVLPDGGVTLGERLDELGPVEAMVVLPEYGRLQRDLGPHVDELLRLGLADMRASVMPLRFVGADDPAVVRPRDAYLEVFGALASRAELVGELELACQVGKVGRALSWHRALRMSGDEEAGELVDGPLVALGSLLSDSWLEAV